MILSPRNRIRGQELAKHYLLNRNNLNKNFIHRTYYFLFQIFEETSIIAEINRPSNDKDDLKMKNYNVMRNLCKGIFYVGAGNFWYEGDIGNDKTVYYRLFSFLLYSIYGGVTVLEVLAAAIGSFPEGEKNDAIAFAVSHTIIMIKMFSILSKRELIKKLICDLIWVCKSHEDDVLAKKKYHILKVNFAAYCVFVFGAGAGYVVQGLLKLNEGLNYVAIVTYYPSYDDYSLLAVCFRQLTTVVVLLMLMTTMIVSVDGFAMVILIVFKYKFITLRRYFKKLNEDVKGVVKRGEVNVAFDKLSDGLKEGIIMHRELLRLSIKFDEAFGTVMAVQLVQSTGSAVFLLLQVAASYDANIVTTVKSVFFMFGLFLMLGLFLINAGEVTYQASIITDSIFYCGWHLCPSTSPAYRKIRQLVLISNAQAQRPLTMKAFKMVELTYATYLEVIKMTYTIFAVYCTRKT